MSASRDTTIRRFFAGTAEQVFISRLGVANPLLIDYVVGMLLRFVRTEKVYGMRTITGTPLADVAGMLIEAGMRIGSARRAAHRQIGDFTLFWAGMYPEALRELQSPTSPDYFLNYCAQGKRAYLVASSLESHASVDDPPGEVLAVMSQNFELVAYGLREIRREFDHPDEEGNRCLLF